METFSPTPLSSSGRPILLDEEVEMKIIEHVSVIRQDPNNHTEGPEIYPPGLLVLTNFRLIIVVNTTTSSTALSSCTLLGWGISLRHILSCSDCATFLRASKRLHIDMETTAPGNLKSFGLRFHKGGKEELLDMLHKTLTKKSWEQISRDNTTRLSGAVIYDNQRTAISTKSIIEDGQKINKSFSASNAGVSGIVRRQNMNIQAVDSLAKSALIDLDALANKAREVVSVVQRYAVYMQETKDQSQVGSESGSDGGGTPFSDTTSQIAEVNEMESIMQSIGIVSPVTRLAAGRSYHQQLARQIADILIQQNRLQRLGGMITLSDLYCLVNRARGTELLSPDDLLSAVQCMPQLRLGMQLYTFSSGVKVIQLDSLNENDFFDKLADVAKKDPEFSQNGMNATHVARLFNVSLILAKERLIAAEKKEYICRDESIEGLQFFVNKFKDL